MMKRISLLCPVDFSAVNDQAAHAAAALARKCGGKLELVHILPAGQGDALLERTLARGAEARMQDRVTRLTEAGAEVSGRVVAPVHGEKLMEGITRLTRESGADLLVVSTGGRSGGGRWFMGSIATALAQESPVPVLIVKDAATLITWADGAGPALHVTAPLELDDSSGRLLRAAAGLGFADRATISVVHVRQFIPANLGDPMLYGMPIAMPMPVISEDDAEAALRRMTDKALPGVNVHVQADAVGLDPAAVLREILGQEKAGLLVLGAHHRTGLERFFSGSVSEPLLSAVQMNVLCIPLRDAAAEDEKGATGKKESAPEAQVDAEPAADQPVLCATDFTFLGDDALRAGRALALRLGMSWRVAHVLEPLSPVDSEESAELVRDGAQARLKRASEGSVIAPTALTVIEREPGEPVASAIIKHAAQVDAGVLVVSTHGRSGSPWWPLGSTSIAIAESAACPVLVTSDSSALHEWSLRHHGLGILAGIDTDGDNQPVFAWLERLARAGGCRITLASVAPAPAEEKSAESAVQITVSRLQELAAHHLPTTPVDCVGLHGATADSLLTAARENECDLLVLGTHHRHGLSRLLRGSVSRRVLGHSACPVLCVPLGK